MYDICEEEPIVVYSEGDQGKIVTWTDAKRAHGKILSSNGLVLLSNLNVCIKPLDSTSEKKEIYHVPGVEHKVDFQLGEGCVYWSNLYVTLWERNPMPRRNDAVPLMLLNLCNPFKLEKKCDLVTGTDKNNTPEGVNKLRISNNRFYFVPYGSPERLLVQEPGKAPRVVLEAKHLNEIDEFAVYKKGDINL